MNHGNRQESLFNDLDQRRFVEALAERSKTDAVSAVILILIRSAAVSSRPAAARPHNTQALRHVHALRLVLCTQSALRKMRIDTVSERQLANKTNEQKYPLMTVALAEDVEDFLRDLVRSGVCADASELVNDVIRSIREQQQKPFEVTPELEAWLLEAADKPATPLSGADFDVARYKVGKVPSLSEPRGHLTVRSAPRPRGEKTRRGAAAAKRQR